MSETQNPDLMQKIKGFIDRKESEHPELHDVDALFDEEEAAPGWNNSGETNKYEKQ